MALSRRRAPSALLLLVLLVATEMGATTTKVAEARDCVSQSHNFKGACLSSSNCAAVCRTENFPRRVPHAALRAQVLLREALLVRPLAPSCRDVPCMLL
ncbi:defensin-like protein CAL1 [Triticum aestivum]|uniref:defensin-like protein CAL1 n=1 Tax=Triticum aestivum TaxID=4565 RepID=UPI001D017904|nr:defensin-like protein CAL1 [Triticum aestivum]